MFPDATGDVGDLADVEESVHFGGVDDGDQDVPELPGEREGLLNALVSRRRLEDVHSGESFIVGSDFVRRRTTRSEDQLLELQYVRDVGQALRNGKGVDVLEDADGAVFDPVDLHLRGHVVRQY